jgi:hypothetical protein
MKTTILKRQNLLDIALQEYGNVTAVFDLAFSNGFSITDIVETGSILNIPESKYKDIEILNFYKRRDIKPATLNPDINSGNEATGIGIMQVESITNTFKVG